MTHTFVADLEHPHLGVFQTAAGVIRFIHPRSRSTPMAALSDVQAAFDAYVAAVNAKLSDLEAQVAADKVDLDPLAASIAQAEAALNPAPPA